MLKNLKTRFEHSNIRNFNKVHSSYFIVFKFERGYYNHIKSAVSYDGFPRSSYYSKIHNVEI